MKIISYNINTCSQRKIKELFKMDADVYVVPEIEREDKIKLPDGFEMKRKKMECVRGIANLVNRTEKSLRNVLCLFVNMESVVKC